MRLHLIKKKKKHPFNASPLNLLSIKHCTLKHMTLLPKTETKGETRIEQIYKNKRSLSLFRFCPEAKYIQKLNQKCEYPKAC